MEDFREMILGPATSVEARRVWPARSFQPLRVIKMVRKDQDGSHKLTSQGQRDLGRMAWQSVATNKKH